MKVKSLSRVRFLATLWTAAYQAPLSMGFSRQEYWSGVPLPSPAYSYRGEQKSENRIISLNIFLKRFGISFRHKDYRTENRCVSNSSKTDEATDERKYKYDC